MDQINCDGRIVTLIHFVFFQAGSTSYRISCMPDMTEFHRTMYHGEQLRSDDARAATCPACKKTKEYAEAMDRLRAMGAIR